MERVRRHLFAVTVAALSLHVSVVALGALRVCWGEHAHAGGAAEDCPMHHHADSQSTHHADHGHGSAAERPNDDGERVACGCSNDPTSPYVGPAGIIVPAVSLSRSTQLSLVTAQGDQSPAEVTFPPLSPPPRAIFSSLS